jgi:hypothetical protein
MRVFGRSISVASPKASGCGGARSHEIVDKGYRRGPPSSLLGGHVCLFASPNGFQAWPGGVKAFFGKHPASVSYCGLARAKKRNRQRRAPRYRKIDPALRCYLGKMEEALGDYKWIAADSISLADIGLAPHPNCCNGSRPSLPVTSRLSAPRAGGKSNDCFKMHDRTSVHANRNADCRDRADLETFVYVIGRSLKQRARFPATKLSLSPHIVHGRGD